jgi:hypothetical protein
MKRTHLLVVGVGLATLTACGSSSGGPASPSVVTVTATQTAQTETQTAETAPPTPPTGPASVADPSSIRENSPCEQSQNGMEINGFHGSPLKCDGSTWVPQY